MDGEGRMSRRDLGTGVWADGLVCPCAVWCGVTWEHALFTV